MKQFKNLVLSIIGISLLLGLSVSPASAAYPVDANISPAHETKIGSSAWFTKRLSWGGGATNVYYISYYDGKATIFYDPQANYYSYSSTSFYDKGSLSTRTWNTSLYVSNGSSTTVYGSVTLKDR
ncbi:hypothetical protein AT864_01833 [Anoxybacillus sp. P3H1B]|uniref:hypothetical protein n=1 Tax=Anoxybacillus sp. P3H1B TaxID=1769293 RepID=UPI00079374EC|nr:hypothetical protein [Anoxybacillus sp. P3H1B]KXG09874.1 hypothetical protein AT864_01833 [Anoxybacillus sp. P3H1B]